MSLKHFAHRWNNILHRDLGYLFAGMTVIYALSGIALNHLNDWDPSYSIELRSARAAAPLERAALRRPQVERLLADWGIGGSYRKHYFPDDATMRVFFRGGSATLDLESGEAAIELVERRPVFFESNFLHYNKPRFLWTWFADIFAGALVVLAVTGLFVLKGRKGISGRGAWLTALGLVIPAVFLIAYL
jgi:uncharacterized protein